MKNAGMIPRYVAELIGTFVIVFAPVALSATSAFEMGPPDCWPRRWFPAWPCLP